MHGPMVASPAEWPMRDGDRDDLDLHRRLAAGDRDAFDELYRRYAPTAYGIAYRLTGQRLLAQDVVHDAFLALWRAPEAFDRGRGRSGASSCPWSTTGPWTRSGGRSGCGPGHDAAELEPVAGEDLSEGVVEEDFIVRRRREVREALAGSQSSSARFSRWRTSDV